MHEQVSPPTRRALLAASAATAALPILAHPTAAANLGEAAVLALGGAYEAKAANPDAELLRLAAEYDVSEVAFEPIIRELGRIETIYFAIDRTGLSIEEDEQLERELGVTAARAAEAEAAATQDIILEAIRQTPARTLAGLRIKAAIFAEDPYGGDKDMGQSLAEDVLALTAPQLSLDFCR